MADLLELDYAPPLRARARAFHIRLLELGHDELEFDDELLPGVLHAHLVWHQDLELNAFVHVEEFVAGDGGGGDDGVNDGADGDEVAAMLTAPVF
jgi:hypothetical protein